MKFFKFSQNNTGGEFVLDKTFGYDVYVQAKTADKANERAEKGGIYFDGLDTGRDCSCCGPRWTRAYDDDDVMTTEEVLADYRNNMSRSFSYTGHSVVWLKSGDKVLLQGETKLLIFKKNK